MCSAQKWSVFALLECAILLLDTCSHSSCPLCCCGVILMWVQQKENDAYRFKRRQMMQVTIWPKGYEEAKAARFAAMKQGPKPYAKAGE